MKQLLKILKNSFVLSIGLLLAWGSMSYAHSETRTDKQTFQTRSLNSKPLPDAVVEIYRVPDSELIRITRQSGVDGRVVAIRSVSEEKFRKLMDKMVFQGLERMPFDLQNGSLKIQAPNSTGLKSNFGGFLERNLDLMYDGSWVSGRNVNELRAYLAEIDALLEPFMSAYSRGIRSDDAKLTTDVYHDKIQSVIDLALESLLQHTQKKALDNASMTSKIESLIEPHGWDINQLRSKSDYSVAGGIYKELFPKELWSLSAVSLGLGTVVTGIAGWAHPEMLRSDPGMFLELFSGTFFTMLSGGFLVGTAIQQVPLLFSTEPHPVVVRKREAKLAKTVLPHLDSYFKSASLYTSLQILKDLLAFHNGVFKHLESKNPDIIVLHKSVGSDNQIKNKIILNCMKALSN